MSHFNKQLEVQHTSLENYLAEQTRRQRNKNRMDGFGLGLMIFCGFFGLFYCISHANSIMGKHKRTGQGSQIFQAGMANATIPGGQKNVIQPVGLPVTKNENSQKFVSIQGIPKVGEKLYFTLDEYNPEVFYEFNFGNGDYQTIHSNQMSYSYDLPGSYDVVLKVKYQGETAVAFTKTLNIK